MIEILTETEDLQARAIKERAALERSIELRKVIQKGDELRNLKEGYLLLERIAGHISRYQDYSARRISSSLANPGRIYSSDLASYESARASRDEVLNLIADTLDEIDFIYIENK